MVTSAASEPESTDRCCSCGTVRSGRFCAQCGEKRVEPDDLAPHRFLGEALQALTSVESNAFRSFAALLTRPGLLTAEYIAGKRVRYLRPLQLFFLCNLVYFFAQTYFPINTFNTPLQVHLFALPYSRFVRPLVESVIRSRGIAPQEYQAHFDAQIENYAKTIVIVMVPLLAVLLQAMYWRRRRPYGEYLVFACHFYAFTLMALPLLPLIGRGIFLLSSQQPWLRAMLRDDAVFSGIAALGLSAYLYVAMRRVYPQTPIAALLRTLFLVYGLLIVVQIYRFLLFCATFFSV